MLKITQLLADNVAYICKMDAYEGTPNMRKIINLEVPFESMKKLINKESISLPDGRIITPNDVLGFHDDEKTFIGSFITCHGPTYCLFFAVD